MGLKSQTDLFGRQSIGVVVTCMDGSEVPAAIKRKKSRA